MKKNRWEAEAQARKWLHPIRVFVRIRRKTVEKRFEILDLDGDKLLAAGDSWEDALDALQRVMRAADTSRRSGRDLTERVTNLENALRDLISISRQRAPWGSELDRMEAVLHGGDR